MRWWHIDQLMPIEAELFGDEQWSAAMFWNELANGHHYIAATDGGAIIGYAGLAVVRPEAWVNNIAVRRDRQRTGVGRVLMDALLAHARAAGASHTLLEVAADNAPAQKMYAGYGFEVVGVRRGYYQPSNTDALVFACAQRLRREPRSSHAQETEAPEDKIENDGRCGDRAEKMRLAEPADDRRIGDAEQGRRQMRERHRQREPDHARMADLDGVEAWFSAHVRNGPG